MVKRTTKEGSAKKSSTSFRAIKRQAKAGAVAKKESTKSGPPRAPRTLIGPEAHRDERFRELVAWYMLQGLDETTARRHAHDEIDDDPRKD
jgi:hypothetical protein